MRLQPTLLVRRHDVAANRGRTCRDAVHRHIPPCVREESGVLPRSLQSSCRKSRSRPSHLTGHQAKKWVPTEDPCGDPFAPCLKLEGPLLSQPRSAVHRRLTMTGEPRFIVLLDVKVEGELVWMRPQAHFIDLPVPLEVQPGVQGVFGEHVPLHQEVVIPLQRQECVLQATRH